MIHTSLSVTTGFHTVLLTLIVVESEYQQLRTGLVTWQLQTPEAEI